MINSFKNLNANIDYSRLSEFVASSAHCSFKDNYQVCIHVVITYRSTNYLLTLQYSTSLSQEFEEIVGNPDSHQFTEVFEHVLSSGKYADAKKHAMQSKHKPWYEQVTYSLIYSLTHTLTPRAVLVTGLNGIRKTTTINSINFEELLRSAMPLPPAGEGVGADTLPTGANSFYRQLDYMIATIANSEFKNLYTAGNEHYIEYKNAIFSR